MQLQFALWQKMALKLQTTPLMKYFLHMHTYFNTLKCTKEGRTPKCAKLGPSGPGVMSM